ncbi:phage tail protein [Photorhabdus luminescens]|uniref:Phage tail protein n=1 Tax=Photorhabdus akhurstii TaxID=171438 RepID=A0ABX8LVR1_9GAMM|nr:phage tail sheath C-terminal domain-containing protein [Photorhabdus akhurstii]QXF33233.1 phage tail protein [Photorhabdus akhurstii]UJD75029.1 phage tail protein [Photorhabdus luminescens]
MTTQTSYPGVYIEEDASLDLSVSQGNTAIPVFIGRFSPKKAETPPLLQITHINSWLDFTNLFNVGCITSIQITSTKIESKPLSPAPVPQKSEGNAEARSDMEVKDDTQVKGNTEIVPTTKTTIQVEDGDPGYTYVVNVDTYTTSSDALKLYFQNGGGPCYILPLSDQELTGHDLKLIPELIEQALEITLIVCPEKGHEPNWEYKNAIYKSLDPLLKAGYFLIADSQTKTKIPDVNVKSQTATYYPPVKVSQLIQTEDSAIAVLGYLDAEHNAVENLAQLKEKNPAVYQQAINKIQDTIKSNGNFIPVSAVIAGVYCATDASRGVWKAPANVVLNGISDVTERLTDDDQSSMDPLGINAIRYFNNRGIIVWGARTLQNDDNWRYIPVRRLFNSAERDIKQAMQFAVFEPNSQPTWERVRSAINNYLYSLWQQGGLAGTKPDEAYFVQIGKGVTMSDDDIKQGKMIVKIGMAAVRPAEFIILQFSQNVAQ